MNSKLIIIPWPSVWLCRVKMTAGLISRHCWEFQGTLTDPSQPTCTGSTDAPWGSEGSSVSTSAALMLLWAGGQSLTASFPRILKDFEAWRNWYQWRTRCLRKKTFTLYSQYECKWSGSVLKVYILGCGCSSSDLYASPSVMAVQMFLGCLSVCARPSLPLLWTWCLRINVHSDSRMNWLEMVVRSHWSLTVPHIMSQTHNQEAVSLFFNKIQCEYSHIGNALPYFCLHSHIRSSRTAQ